MEAIEFPVKISEKYKTKLNPNQEVRVIILINEDNEDNEDDWDNLTLREFFKGYNEKDSAYDSI